MQSSTKLILSTPYCTWSWESCYFRKIIRIFRQTDLVSCSSWIKVVCSPSSSGINKFSSIGTGAEISPPPCINSSSSRYTFIIRKEECTTKSKINAKLRLSSQGNCFCIQCCFCSARLYRFSQIIHCQSMA